MSDRISGQNLQDARRIIADLTQSELAELLGVSVRTIVNWESDGVPAARTRLVRSKFGKALDAWEDSKITLEEYGQLPTLDPDPAPEPTPKGRSVIEDRLRDSIQQATHAQLLDELARRLHAGD